MTCPLLFSMTGRRNSFVSLFTLTNELRGVRQTKTNSENHSFRSLAATAMFSTRTLYQGLQRDLSPRLTHPAIHRSTDPSIYRSIDLPIHRSTDPSIYQSIDLLIHRSTDPSIYRSIDLPIHRSTDPSIYRSIDPSIY